MESRENICVRGKISSLPLTFSFWPEYSALASSTIEASNNEEQRVREVREKEGWEGVRRKGSRCEEWTEEGNERRADRKGESEDEKEEEQTKKEDEDDMRH